MPICLKCGNAIEPGRSYCGECGLAGKAQVERMFSLVEGSSYRKKRTSGIRLVAIFMVGIVATLMIITYAVFTMMPSGPEFASKAQAGICRSNMRRIELEIERYRDVENEYPPTGRIDGDHPLVVDRYLAESPKCPTTDHYYVLVESGSRVMVTCDSGEDRHEI
ncbi:MAG: hypothetical protein KKB90_08910 [Actinobacteria bacterium]|nr:hypothetical protein [Actinomycetota bacterium]MCG2819191.1 hypothetical protein [Actinomycetes bacterium]MBU4179533.1 hypothetical protein [Actinomycetota bacterium]MBU4219061.1 hypothetical protein [Actinomycetota bacterium]MBU4359249.1 hypothetical protein [Actinomycetota bacterium]